MAKVRVYELAKELNTDSKALVEKLKAGGMDIKNYMSTLDEDAVAKARDIFNGKVSEVIEEKRIKPTVIRRRKRTVRVEAPGPEAAETEARAEAAVEGEVAEQPVKIEPERPGKEPAPERVAEAPPQAGPSDLEAAQGKLEMEKAPAEVETGETRVGEAQEGQEEKNRSTRQNH
ncbi:MAG: translation initiation factor IF-2 N-terminal domain-containing protein [Deltaproteobacteria bacterium]|nr:translation initiation factor IF-2 N-terminal domain-containing protein [Deltaproteobacteria bacterium]